MQRLKPIGWGVLLSTLLTAPLVAIMYLADQLLDLPFVPFNFFDWFAGVLPGDLLTFGIDLMIDTLLFIGGAEAVTNAKTAEQGMAVLMFATAAIVVGTLYVALINWTPIRANRTTGLAAGMVLGVPMVLISAAVSASSVSAFLAIPWLLILFAAWGALLAWSTRRVIGAEAVAEETAVLETEARVSNVDRRRFLIGLGASTATITVIGATVGGRLAQAAEQARRAAGNAAASLAGITNITSFPNDGDPVLPAPGTRSEYTPVSEHYQVFLRTEPSIIEEAEWSLPITGMVDNPVNLTLAEIRQNYTARDQFVTLSCISGRIATSLISTTMWTGVSAQELLATVGIQPGAKYLDITSEDGFHETIPLELINNDERILFAYDWDGAPIPKDHGFPLRIWIPDRYGMKQPKWITGIEVTDQYREGYWVERNWDEVAQVKTTSVIDTVALDAREERLGQTFIPVGGIAFSGDRQISKVEVRVDGGPWQAAELRSPLSETTWVIWRFEWPFAEGEHTFEVRCEEGDGTPQIAERSPQRPDGATGIHSYDI